MMEAGRLRHRVTIESPTSASSPYGAGAAAPTWSPVGDVYAEVRPLRAVEKVRAQQPGMETAYIVTMRFNSMVTSKCRLVWEGRPLDITGITDVDGRHVHLEVLCTEQETADAA